MAVPLLHHIHVLAAAEVTLALRKHCDLVRATQPYPEGSSLSFLPDLLLLICHGTL